MEKKVTKTILKSLLLLTAGLWTLHVNAQWTGISPAPCVLNPLNNDQDAGININTATGFPEGKLHIHQWANSQNWGANKKHLVLGLAWDMPMNPYEPEFILKPTASATNDYSIEPNVGQHLEIYKLESSASMMNAKGPIVNYTGNKSLVVRFNPYTTSFSSSISIQRNLNVTGTSTLQALTASDITANSLTVNTLNINNIPSLSIGAKKPTGAFANYTLSVDGTIVSTRNVVQITSWADKVFQKNYRLMSLSEIEAFVSKYKHLPEIPSEAEVLENGVDVGEMNKLLLQKVEELTLHLIEQDKTIKALKKKVDGLTK